jgi:hypothetical protein
MAAAAACLVAASSSADGAWGGEPMDFDRTIKCFFPIIYLYVNILLTSTGHRGMKMEWMGGVVHENGKDGMDE